MKSFNNGVSRGLILAGSATLLAACGGGGGGDTPFVDGEQGNPYVISLRADRTQLPLNLKGLYPGTGLEAIYTTTLYVSARRQRTGDVIPSSGDDEVFGCNVIPTGLEYGALAYNDGEDDHMVEIDDGNGNKVKVPGQYRSIGLPSNAGGNSFHFHAGSQTGTATVTCAVADPQSGRQVSTSIEIQVGGTSSGKAATVTVETESPGYLFIKDQNGRQKVLTATIRDEAWQPIADSAAPLCARIEQTHDAVLRSEAYQGAQLFSGGNSVPVGQWIRANSIRGEARFMLAVGSTNLGPIAVRVAANRDGNPADCNTFDVQNLAVIHAVDNISGEYALVINNRNLSDYYVGRGYLVKDGDKFSFNDIGSIILDTLNTSVQEPFYTGTPPYYWTTLGTLPPGVTLSSEGLLSGRPTAASDTPYRFRVRVEDSSLSPRLREEKDIELPVYDMPDLKTTGLEITCENTLNDEKQRQDMSVEIEVTGGKAPLSLAADNLPGTVILAQVADGNGEKWVLTGRPEKCEERKPDTDKATFVLVDETTIHAVPVTVTDANGVSVTKTLRVSVTNTVNEERKR